MTAVAGRADDGRPARPSRNAHRTAVHRLTLDLLAESRQPMKAYALLAKLEERLGRPLSPPTVYRALESLLAAGQIARIESQAAFLPIDPASTRTPRVFLLCNDCGDAREVADIAIATALKKLTAAQEFSVGRSVIEIEGRCRSCRPNAAAGAAS